MLAGSTLDSVLQNFTATKHGVATGMVMPGAQVYMTRNAKVNGKTTHAIQACILICLSYTSAR
jgi:hypothetical protein